MLDREALGDVCLADDRQAIKLFRKAGLSVRLKRGASLIAIVLLSLGLWVVIWEAVASVASVVLQ